MPGRKPSCGSVLLAGFLIGSVTTGLAVACLLQNDGGNWLASVFGGAAVGVVGSWFVCGSVWHIWMRITRGAPFHVGDRVMITDGPLRGKIGEVRKLDEGRCSVAVGLTRERDASALHFFDWDQIRRAR